jgi:hypothetical protein
MINPSATTRIDGLPAVQADSSNSRKRLLAVVYLILVAVALYPILSVDVPPLVDYPNHLARMHILNAWGDDPDLQRNYVVNWSIGPNMAMDFIVPVIAKVLPIYDAGKVFVAATLLLIIGGTITLRYVVVGHVGLWPILSFLLIYNHAFYWGFLNFLFTAGLALFAFAAWIGLRERPSSTRLIIFSLVAVILFYGHLFGLLIYGVLVLGFEVRRAWQNRHDRSVLVSAWFVNGAQFLLPMILFFEWIDRIGSADGAINRFGPWAAKIIALISPVHFGQPWVDFSTALFLSVVGVLCITRRWVRLADSLKMPVILLAVVAALMPNFLSGVWGTDFRLPAIVGCVLLAGIQTRPFAWRQMQIIVSIAAALFLIRTATIASHWHDVDAKFSDFRNAARSLEPGASLLVSQDRNDAPDGASRLHEMTFWHLGALAVIERSAFYPTLFTGHTTIDASAATAQIDSPVGTPVSRKILSATADPSKSPYPLSHRLSRYVWLYWIGWPAHFDYVLSIRHDNSANPYPSRLERLHEGSYFDIYRVTRP